MAVDHNNPQSRDEEILIATIDGTEYNKNPQSRMEELLLELKEAIEEGGGGGGTTDYENLSNQPQVNGETLIGDKSGADLGLVDAEEGKGLSTNDYDDTEKAAVADATSAISAMKDGTDIDSFGDVEVALLDKQDELTAGKYIQFTNDEISVKRDIAYEADEVLFAEQTNEGLHVTVTVGSTTLYEETLVTSDSEHTVLDLVQTRFSFRAVRWILTYLKASKTRSAGDEAVVWPSVTDTFVTTVDADKKLIIQSELDDAINSAVSKCYHHAGTKTCAELLPALLIAANEGNVYEITDSGTTTSDFMEGIGHPIKEGDNIGVARVSEGVYKFDLLSGFVDTSNFVQKSSTAGLIMNDGTIDTVAKQPATDNNLTTTDKTTTGAVNELMSGLTTLDNEVNGDATVYPYADVITIEDAVPSNLADCTVKIEPVQDLHGYDHPWVGGANTNKVIYPYITTYPFVYGGVTVNDNKGRITITGNATSSFTTVLVGQSDSVFGNVANAVPLLNADGKYTISGGTIVARLKVRQYRDGSLLDEHICTGTPIVIDVLSTDLFEIGISIYVNNAYNDTVSPQIEAGETATAWKPYSNICPISGHTEASVQRDGVNLFNKDDSDIAINKYLNHNTGELTNSSNNWDTSGYIYIHHLIGEDIVFSGMNSVAQSDWEVCYYDKNKTFVSGVTGKAKTRTIPNDDRIAYLRFDYKHADTDVIQLEEGSTATPYVPYAGKTYTIALGDTIYGGTVDFDSGVMTVTHGGIILDGTEASKYSLIESGRINYDNADMLYKKFTENREISSSYTVLPQAPTNADFKNLTGYADGVCDFSNASTAGVYTIRIRDDRFTDLQTALNLLAAETPNFVFELATPTTIQLTPQQIQLLKGTNTLTASTGDISVTVNGVSGSIGQVQSEVNELAEDVADVQSDMDSLYVTATGNVASTEYAARTSTTYGVYTCPNGYMPIGVYITSTGGYDGQLSAALSVKGIVRFTNTSANTFTTAISFKVIMIKENA